MSTNFPNPTCRRTQGFTLPQHKGAGNIALRVKKVLAAKPGNLILIPHTVEGENQLPQVVF